MELRGRWFGGFASAGGGGFWRQGIGEEGFEFGARNVSVEDVREFFPEVAFRLVPVDPDVSRLDAIRPELLGEPQIVDGFALAHLGPRTTDESVQLGHERAGENALDVPVGEQEEYVQEQGPD